MSPPMLTRPKLEMDLGGTWLRRRHDGRSTNEPAVSRLNRPDIPADRLVDDLVTRLVHHLPPDADVAISCGAALDERIGIAYGSGPLWGDRRNPVPLAALLRERRPDVVFRLVNDVTAAVVDFCATVPDGVGPRVAYLTVSSGIALRVADPSTRTVTVDRRGLQGEVGHLAAGMLEAAVGPLPPLVRARLATLPCECGGSGHVASVAAGPAFAAVAAALDSAVPEPATLANSLDAGDPGAAALLRVVVAPVAEIVRTARALDPGLGLVGVGGGVAEGLGHRYESELVRQLALPRSYADPPADEAAVRRTVRVCRPGEVDPMTGARRVADGDWHVRAVTDTDTDTGTT